MTKTIQLLRGTTAQNDAFTGAAGELTVDTTTNELRVHDGSTAGGHIIYTKLDVDTALSSKADTATTYTKTEVDTIASDKADDNAVVHLTGTETITGLKTFQDARMAQEITSGSYLDFYQYIDGDRRGAMRTFKDSNDANHYYTIFGNCGPNAEAPQGMTVHRNASTTWATAPAPAAGDNSSKIATTEWVHNAAPNLAMPGNRYTNLTLGASWASYTAPSDGYVVIRKNSTAANQYVKIVNRTSETSTATTSPYSGFDTSATLPVSKGDSFQVAYNADGTTNYFRFVYANGAS